MSTCVQESRIRQNFLYDFQRVKMSKLIKNVHEKIDCNFLGNVNNEGIKKHMEYVQQSNQREDFKRLVSFSGNI